MKEVGIQSVPIASLVEDMNLYPRHAVDMANVAQLAQALDFGANLPPPRVDEASKRIVDGWHRVRSYRKVKGPEAVIDVLFVRYKDEAEIIYDAVQCNSSHGRKLDAIDRTRSVLMLEKAGFNDAKIALALHTPEKVVCKLKLKIATASVQTSQTVPGTKKITLKAPFKHMTGQRLTREQAEVHDSGPGVSFLLISRQLSDALTNDMINREDEKLTIQLRKLHDDLEQWLLAAQL